MYQIVYPRPVQLLDRAPDNFTKPGIRQGEIPIEISLCDPNCRLTNDRREAHLASLQCDVRLSFLTDIDKRHDDPVNNVFHAAIGPHAHQEGVSSILQLELTLDNSELAKHLSYVVTNVII